MNEAKVEQDQKNLERGNKFEHIQKDFISMKSGRREKNIS
jgi:hypothetical protein